MQVYQHFDVEIVPLACKFITKTTPAQVFTCKFFEFFQPAQECSWKILEIFQLATLDQVFFCEFLKMYKNTYFAE